MGGVPLNILVVDDEQPIRDLLLDFLELDGHRVFLAENGAVGLEIARKEGAALHLLLVDGKMPVLGGLEMLAQLRAEGCAVPAVVMTGHSELDQQSNAKLGVVAVIEKPFSFRRVRKVLEGFPAKA